MKLWIDDVRPAPDLSYFWMTSVNGARDYIIYWEKHNHPVELIDINSKFVISMFSWLKETNRVIPYRIHQD